MAQRHLLVTGASGFIGRRLVEALLADRRLRVHGCSTSPIDALDSAYTHHVVNLADASFAAGLPAEIDTIVHLAQSRDYASYPERANAIADVNVAGTQRLLEYARANGARRFINVSSGSVYSSSAEATTEESSTRPESFYGLTKRLAEDLVTWHERFFETVSIRLFVPYGPGQEDRLIPRIVNRVRDGEPVTLARGAGVIMNPIFIGDVIRAIELLARREEAVSGIYNLGGSETVSLGRIVAEAAELFELDPVVDESDEAPAVVLGDSARFYADFAFTPQTPFTEGIASLAAALST